MTGRLTNRGDVQKVSFRVLHWRRIVQHRKMLPQREHSFQEKVASQHWERPLLIPKVEDGEPSSAEVRETSSVPLLSITDLTEITPRAKTWKWSTRGELIVVDGPTPTDRATLTFVTDRKDESNSFLKETDSGKLVMRVARNVGAFMGLEDTLSVMDLTILVPVYSKRMHAELTRAFEGQVRSFGYGKECPYRECVVPANPTRCTEQHLETSVLHVTREPPFWRFRSCKAESDYLMRLLCMRNWLGILSTVCCIWTSLSTSCGSFLFGNNLVHGLSLLQAGQLDSKHAKLHCESNPELAQDSPKSSSKNEAENNGVSEPKAANDAVDLVKTDLGKRETLILLQKLVQEKKKK
ncbi:hypothetical protein GOP47_0023024 [Adiantum capillus-veneris]|uniref:Uncharacterized protein n=1 Tax=Adiantum capillus-veneris TaxID=13818 RepID=A0A9D4Z637_ADICA|nr:hypothetical protein GOP47_0023024 [Adiantum capillus-veneris]